MILFRVIGNDVVDLFDARGFDVPKQKSFKFRFYRINKGCRFLSLNDVGIVGRYLRSRNESVEKASVIMGNTNVINTESDFLIRHN